MHGQPANYREHLRASLRGQSARSLRSFGDVIDALTRCTHVCTACAEACLGEPSRLFRLRRFIRTHLDCAEVCAATVQVLTRKAETSPDLIHAQVRACILSCVLCADECRHHETVDKLFRTCADICSHCRERCNRLLQEIGANERTFSRSLIEGLAS